MRRAPDDYPVTAWNRAVEWPIHGPWANGRPDDPSTTPSHFSGTRRSNSGSGRNSRNNAKLGSLRHVDTVQTIRESAPDLDTAPTQNPTAMGGESKTMTKMTRAQTAERDEAIAKLRELLTPGDTLYTVVRHVSSSGMSRSISVVRAVRDGDRLEVENLDFWVSKVVRERIDRRYGGVIQTGCGMDMGFHLVYGLGRYLWPDGTGEPHGTRNGRPDTDGGYALKHRWL